MLRRATLCIAGLAALALFGSAPAMAAQPYPVNFKTFALNASDSTRSGTVLSGNSLTLGSSGLGTMTYADPFANFNGDGVDGSGDYSYGTWTSGVTYLDFGFNELVSSWNANTPTGTWIQVEMQPQIDDGHWAKWYILGRWTYGDSDFHRTSVGGQKDGDGFVSIDTWFAHSHPAIAYRLRLTLFRRVGSTNSPSVSRLSAIASNSVNQKMTFPSKTTMTGTNVDLGLPQYSQELHHGEYPQFDGGGEAWCSPTSTSMVVAYWSALTGHNYAPTPTETAGIPYADPWVDYTARYVFDYHYDGAGNWPFNAGYAAARGLVADVTQLHSLAEAEPFIEDGIPLVASVAWQPNKLTGGIKSTNGHLLVIEGFTGDGSKVIVDDPASPDDGSVKHYYDRAQFEKAWIPASGGIVYVIRPADWPMPSLTQNNS